MFSVGAIGFPHAFHLGGDLNEKAYARARDNVKDLIDTGDREVKAEGDEVNNYVKEKSKYGLNVDIMWWDVMRLPLRTNSVDVFVTDLVHSLFLSF